MVARQLAARGIKDPRVLAAMGRVPRHRFVSKDLERSAYDDGPLLIGEGQTISQPYMVAVMIAELDLQGGERVLEVGTGSGYQAAVLAELASQVITLERSDVLAGGAERVLAALGYTNTEVHVADGSLGWPVGAPFDGILVAAGAPHPPRPLLEQLALGGRLVVPVGDRYNYMVETHHKTAAGMEVKRSVPCRFVPLIGAHAWDR